MYFASTYLLYISLQFSTNEDVVVDSGECTGYSWNSRHVTSSRQLQLCVAGQTWSEPFSVCRDRVERVELEVGGQSAVVFVRVTDLGGLQKQVRNLILFTTLYPSNGYWLS